MSTDTSDELVSVLVPRRLYARVIQMLATALATESSGAAPIVPSEHEQKWKPEEIRHLRRVVDNMTVETLMKLTCASPGERVTFQQVYERAGRTFGQARADLAGLTRLIRKSFNHEKWPVTVFQGPDKVTMYYVEPSIAEAWNNASV